MNIDNISDVEDFPIELANSEFEQKRVIIRVTSTRGTSHNKEDIYNADASFPENGRNGSGESSKIATSGEVEDSETIQTSRHSSDLNVQANDQEVDVAEIDNIIAKKISCLLLESEFTLEEIWKKNFSTNVYEEKFDIGTFELIWTEKESRSVTNRKQKDKRPFKTKDSDERLFRFVVEQITLQESSTRRSFRSWHPNYWYKIHGRPFARFSGESFSIMTHTNRSG
ncbi:hypothetical protein GLOIN_2v1792052 [Rhizophagus irregularis DAOM 181602=DAOM 197198]|nr:hypothetical protein GLOIN_2v1792052 [Rhizophagus irregularis DAOM 181602=DAOM 197198]